MCGSMTGLALVIGAGNDYRGDDGVGPAVARRLRDLLPEQVRVLAMDGEGTALLQSWIGAGLVIVCDATSSGAAPGTIRRFDANQEAIPAQLYRYSSHDFGLAEAVALALALDEAPPHLILYGIEGAGFAPGEALSPQVEAAAERVTQQIVAELCHHGAI